MSFKPITDVEHLYYGDETRWFIGVVEDVIDPLKLGRVKVRIVGVHTPDKSRIPTGDLPWAQCMFPSSYAGTSGLWGTEVNIKPSAQVFGIFLDGKHSQSPLVMGVLPHIEQPPPGGGKYTGEFSTPPGTGPGQSPSSKSGSTGVATPIVGGSRQEKVYNYLEQQFRNKGVKNSKDIAAGFVGNLMVETNGLNPTSRPGDSGTAFGIAQWRNDRFDNLLSFALDRPGATFENAEGTDQKVPDFDTQVAFIWHELTTTETKAYKEIIKSTDAKDAARRIDQYYERSDGTKREQRATNAAAVYDEFTTGDE